MSATNLQRPLLVAALILCVFLPGSSATHQGPDDVNAHDLNVLVYHPIPDEKQDPWGVVAMTVNGTGVDWMAGHYSAYFFPTAVFDGVEIIESTPTVEGAGAYQETYAGYHEALSRRLEAATPVAVRLDASISEHHLAARSTVSTASTRSMPGLVHRIVLFEDEVGFAGGNGIVNHRFVVRALGPREGVDLATGVASFSHDFEIPSFVDEERIGLVALVQNADEASTLFKPKEIVQSATWTVRQEGSTNQAARGVLLEMYSATWCAACVYGDSATDALADEFGIQSSRDAAAGFEYLRPSDPLKVGAALLLGVALVAWTLRTPARRDP